MAVTPQSNATVAEIAEKLRACDNIVIGGHVNPDGDCLGSQLALWHALKALDKRAVCVAADNKKLPLSEEALPGRGAVIAADAYDGACDAFVAVDVPTPERMGEAPAALHKQAGVTFTVDHHAVPERMSDFSYTDPQAASTTMLVWQLIGHLGVQPSAAMATCAYAGLMTDTGRFQYQNTDAAALEAAAELVRAGASPSAIARAAYQNRTLASVKLENVAVSRMTLGCGGVYALTYITKEDYAACNAEKADGEMIIDTLRSLAGVRVACVLREQDESVRGSLRAKDDTDVAALARRFNGGGHRAAAGLTLELPLEQAVETMRAALEELCALEECCG